MPPPAEGFAARIVLGPALRTQPDRRLVTLVREGYEAAFEEIVRRYGKQLGRFAAAIVGGRAEDVTQDAFSKALLALRRDDAEIELRPWLYRIVRNTALNELRDRPPTAETLAEAIAGGRNPAEELEQREQLADLMKRLQALPESQRAAIVMRELEGLSHEEIAAALGLSGGAARQAIHRARTALRDGAGLLLPLPLLRFLVDHGTEVAAAGAGAGTATVAGGAVSGAGAGTLLKAGVVTAVLAGSVGTGVALRESPEDSDIDTVATATAGQTAEQAGPAGSTPPAVAAIAPGSSVAAGDDNGDRHGDATDLSRRDDAGEAFGGGGRHGPELGRKGHRRPRGHRGARKGDRPPRGDDPRAGSRGRRLGGEKDAGGPSGDGSGHRGPGRGTSGPTDQLSPPPPPPDRDLDGESGGSGPEPGSDPLRDGGELP
jgi:RNA polymerase sigma factor (sigma-70 family)